MGHIHVEAPEDLDPLVIAQGVVGSHVLLKATYSKSWEDRPFDRWTAMQDLYERILKIYDSHIKRMVKKISQELGVDDLKKANPPKPILTPQQVERLAKLIRDYHTGFVIQMGAGDDINKAEFKRLVKLGVLPPQSINVVKDSYTFGQLMARLSEMDDITKAKKLTYKEFRKRIKERPIALTPVERSAIDWANRAFSVYTKSRGDKVADEFSKMFISADTKMRRKFMAASAGELKENIERRETVRKLASAIGDRTQDWTRDLGRVAATTKQTAMQEGFAQGLIKREGPPENIFVAKLPKPDACPACVRLHLTAGQGSPPRIFTLRELIENGINTGKKRLEWLPTIGTVHPWCACELVHVPAGWGFQKQPKKGSGFKKVKGRDRWTKDGTPEGRPWRSRMVPESMRTEKAFKRDLMKSFMTYENVPQVGCTIRVGDPEIVVEIERVINTTPKEIFNKDIGVTLITTDSVRPLTALNDHDLAYWTANEIRLSQILPKEKVERVLRHELGHSLNVHLIRKWGGEKAVREWHRKLDKLSAKEGYCSEYCKTHPIENAAELTRLYLYERKKLMLEFPRAFAMLHQAYRDIWFPAKENAA